MKKLLLLILLVISINAISQVFSDDIPGIDSIRLESGGVGSISDFYNDGDSILYIIGPFSRVNNMYVSSVFSWDKQQIKLYQDNPEILYGGVNCITKYNDTIYIGGSFNGYYGHNPDLSRNYLMKWNGENWQGLEAGQPASRVLDMNVFDEKLYVGGEFYKAGKTDVTMLAAYNNGNWDDVGVLFYMWINSIELFDGELYAGGHVSSGMMRQVENNEWEQLPEIPDDHVYCLRTDTFNTFLYVGGMFHNVGDIYSRGCAMWDGFKWHSMNNGDYSGTPGKKGMLVYRGELYTGHCNTYDEENDKYNYFITRWNGERWDSLGGGFNSTILALEVFGGELYIGGGGTEYDGQRSKGIRKMSLPDNGCDYIKPRINTIADTFLLDSVTKIVDVNFYNNNPYVDSWHWDFGDDSESSERNPVHTYTQRGIYEVSITVTHEGCERSYKKIITIGDHNDYGVSVNTVKYSDIKFNIYPNPVASSVSATVEVETINGDDMRLVISGLNGHVKADIPIKSNETIINTENWKPGIYICSLMINGVIVNTEKMIIEN